MRSAANAGGTRRLRVGFGVMLGLLVPVAGRVVIVQGIDPEGLALATTELRTATSTLASTRGDILDINGVVMARSIVKYDIVASPKNNTSALTFERRDADGNKVEITRDAGSIELADVLGRSEAEIRKALTDEGQFSYVARSVTPTIEKLVMDLRIPGAESRPWRPSAIPWAQWAEASLDTRISTAAQQESSSPSTIASKGQTANAPSKRARTGSSSQLHPCSSIRLSMGRAPAHHRQ